MFLNYQPHLYERDRRREREERNAKLEAILDNSSVTSSNQRRRQSVDSAATSNESVPRRSNDRRSSLTPSTSLASPSEYASSKHNVSLTDLPTPSHSSSHQSGGGGLLNLFQLRRNKSSSHDKSSHNKTYPENVPGKSSSRSSRSSERRPQSSNKKERSSQSITRWGGRDVNVPSHSPIRNDKDTSIGEEQYVKMSEYDQSSPSLFTASSQESHFGFTRKQTQRPKMNKRPSTASDRTSLKTERGMFQRMSASRSEQDLLNPTSDEAGRKDLLANFDDQDSQEILTSDEPMYNDRATGGLRISISSDATTTDYHSFDSTVDLSDYPLPVRLGVISASVYIQGESPDLLPASARSSFDLFNSKRSKSPSRYSNSALASGEHQYVEGYYLCTPPPRRAQKKAVKKINAGAMAAATPSSPTRPKMARQRTISSSNSLSGQSVLLKDALNNPISPSTVSSPAFGHPPSLGIYRNGPFMIAQNTPISIEKFNNAPTNNSNQVEERQKWRLSDYFEIESNRRPGKFGFNQSKRHAYPAEEAPYPFAYGNNTILGENLIHAHTENSFRENLYNSSDRQPKRVLDIGCGDGQWILQMAQKWPETEFIGMDLVPIQVPIKALQKDTQKRISWIVGNVLQGLPFPDQCFDLVHIRFLNSGIPKQKWSNLLDDVNRILSPAGNLCIFETDLNFFGSAKRILKSDLSKVETQNYSKSLPFIDSDPKNNRKRDQRNSALESLWQRMLERHDIGLNPTSFLPTMLAEVKDIRQINHLGPKHMPILSRSYAKKAKKEKEIGYFDNATRSSNLDTHSIVKGAKNDLDEWRAAILIGETSKIADAKLTLWHEIMMLRKGENHTKDEEALQGSRTSLSIPASPSLMSNHASNPIEHESYLSPDLSKSFYSDVSIDIIGKTLSERWRDYAHFESEVDQWQAEMHERAEIEHLLKTQIAWSKTAEKFDSWHLSEGKRHVHDHQQTPVQNGEEEEEEIPNNLFFNGAGSEGDNSPSPLTSESASPSQILSESSSERSLIPTSPIEDVVWQPSKSFASDIEQELAIEEQNSDRLINLSEQHKGMIMPVIVANDVESPNLDTPTLTPQSQRRYESILGIRTILLTSARKDDNGGLDLMSSF
ncbi:hypothetical protein L7F22_019177 [Adiantum nelumboides]|nr:hypothetical protein [Adiantum nelumboides]